jgi:hypothetical protein
MDLLAVISELRSQLVAIDQAIRSLEALEHLNSKAVGRQSKERKKTKQDLERATGTTG